MLDFATLILGLTIVVITNPLLFVLLLCPFLFSTLIECIWRKFKINDTTFALLSTLLIMTGVIFMLLGVGLSSPLLTNSSQKSGDSINTIVYFNDQNLSDLKIDENTLIKGGSNNSKLSILNISTTLVPKTPINDLGMLGIIIGVVSLGISLMLSGVAYLLTILKNYENSQLSTKEKFLIVAIWMAFGVLSILYGYYVHIENLSYAIMLIGLIYLILGILFGTYYLGVAIVSSGSSQVASVKTNDAMHDRYEKVEESIKELRNKQKKLF